MQLENTRNHEPASDDLRPFLEDVDVQISTRSDDLTPLQDALEALLEFLSSPEGLTDANCRATDAYFVSGIIDPTRWDYLPEAYREILWDMGGQLHDAVDAPHIADMFESTPEQLLDRVRNLDL